MKKIFSHHPRSRKMTMFQESNRHISTAVPLEQGEYPDMEDFGTTFTFRPLDRVWFSGIVKVRISLKAMECYDMKEGDSGGYAPLSHALAMAIREQPKCYPSRKKSALKNQTIIAEHQSCIPLGKVMGWW